MLRNFDTFLTEVKTGAVFTLKSDSYWWFVVDILGCQFWLLLSWYEKLEGYEPTTRE